MNVGGTRHALELAEALRVGCFHQVSSVAVAGEYDGPFDETMFDEGQALTSPYHRTKFESEKLVRDRGDRAVARLPARDRGRSQRDRRDGQGRRALLRLPRDQGAARRPARLAAAGRRRPRRHQRRAGRLRRRRARPPRPPRGPRRRGLPPRQPRAAAGDGDAQRLLRGRRRPAVRDAGRPQHGRRPARAPARLAASAADRHHRGPQPDRSSCCSTRRSAASASRPRSWPTRRSGRSSTPGVPRRRWPARGSPSPTSSPTPAPCGATGRTTSTSRPGATQPPARP